MSAYIKQAMSYASYYATYSTNGDTNSTTSNITDYIPIENTHINTKNTNVLLSSISTKTKMEKLHIILKDIKHSIKTMKDITNAVGTTQDTIAHRLQLYVYFKQTFIHICI